MLTFPDAVIWLRERTVLGVLPTRVLRAIAHLMTDRVVSAHQQLVQAGAPVKELYILQQGRIQGDRSGQTSSAWAVSWLPGAAIHLQELLLGQPAQRTVVSLSECKLWVVVSRFLSRLSFNLSRNYPNPIPSASPGTRPTFLPIK